MLARLAARRLKCRRGVAMHQRHRRAGVVVEILDGVDSQLRVDHHDHRTNFECAEQRGYELRPVGQRDDHALLRLHAGAHEQMTKTVCECLHLPVGECALVRQQRRPLSPSLADPRVQQPIGEVQALRQLDAHGKG